VAILATNFTSVHASCCEHTDDDDDDFSLFVLTRLFFFFFNSSLMIFHVATEQSPPFRLAVAESVRDG